jgi:hypothetical protein
MNSLLYYSIDRQIGLANAVSPRLDDREWRSLLECEDRLYVRGQFVLVVFWIGGRDASRAALPAAPSQKRSLAAFARKLKTGNISLSA